MRLMMDLMVAAFQSDATRVCTFMLDHGQSNRYFNFIPEVRGTWHALSHYKNASGRTEDDDGLTSWDSVEQKRAMYAEVIRWHHRQVAYLLGRLQSVREPNGGTLLDNSMIVYGATLGDGNEHDARHLPTLLAGGGGGTIETGRFLEHAEPTDLARIHVSLLQRMGGLDRPVRHRRRPARRAGRMRMETMKTTPRSVTVSLGLAAAVCAASLAVTVRAQSEPGDGPRYRNGAELIRPDDYREWMFLSSGLGMTYEAEGGEAAGSGARPQRFQNVFVNRSAYRAFKETGAWPDGSIFVLEIRQATSRRR